MVERSPLETNAVVAERLEKSNIRGHTADLEPIQSLDEATECL